MPITKAVIPCAGLGTRFLPATKAVPKELLPIVDIPIIQHIVREAVQSGIKDIILVTSRGKNTIFDHFDSFPELEAKLKQQGKRELLAALQETSSMAKVTAVRQTNPNGLGDAILCTKDLIGDDSFAVLLGDDLVDAANPCTRQMIEVYKQYSKSVVALMQVSEDEVSQYGICSGHKLVERVYNLDTMVEKPSISDAPSNLAIVGRYILKPSIFNYLAETEPDANGQVQLTHAMERMMKVEGFTGYEFTGDRYDAGDQFGFLQANLAYAMKRRDLAPRLRAFMREMLQNYRS